MEYYRREIIIEAVVIHRIHHLIWWDDVHNIKISTRLGMKILLLIMDHIIMIDLLN